ncbi:probable cleavage and polyadenylation specificity factor subunit 2 [Contarinia nasturtii]|uniref:probable cleavage and polyadenylation specificity factor subunit 2 n=1 Tax=Contarinia nasturtii TaxID=265458 RepID=UPI0012D44219|nr:probable cleavage and polyadenylation specificity factor subunit 2 [Contarinia nasturtii]
MTSIIKLQALSGAMDESPPCYLLQIDEVKILLDCGWDEKFDPNFIKEIKRHVHTIDAILISYPDPLHLGALPYLVGKLGLNCPIYATIPIYKMGQLFMYDTFMSHYNMYDFELFSLDDIDSAFDKIIQLKYNQSVSLKGKGYGITITPLAAGHMIGGTIWKIVKIGEEDIVYATNFNHKKERHLNGCELEKMQRPSLLITDAYNANYNQARRRARDEKLMTNILQTLRNGGNVMVTIDAAGRLLELAHMLEQLWKNKESGLLAYSLALLNNVGYNVVEFAKSQIEWMSDKLMKSFEGARNNPFQFRHLQLCHTLAELQKVPSPKVVLCSTTDMESGYSRELFIQWASNPNNSIIITSRSSPGTLARDLLDNGGNGRKIEIDVRRRVDIEGAELDEYMRTEGEKNSAMKLIKRDVEEPSSDSDDDIEMNVITGKHDIVVRPQGRASTGFFKSSKKQYAMFPFHEDKIRIDDYGEIIQLEEYKLADDIHPQSSGHDDSKENGQIKIENINEQSKSTENGMSLLEKPTKCVSSRKTIDINAQVQFIDFEGSSDGESLLKILSQLRPRRVIVVRGTPENVNLIAKHCKQSIGARVFTPAKGDIIDATTENHIYQVKLTEGLVAKLQFQKVKDADVAWIDAKIRARSKKILPSLNAKATNGSNTNDNAMEIDNEEDDNDDEDEDVTTNGEVSVLPSTDNKWALEPINDEAVEPHKSTFVNELKISDFKQVLSRNNIQSEFSNGALWVANSTIAIRRIDTGKLCMEGCISDEYYRVRDLLYDQYAII